jgi:integrase
MSKRRGDGIYLRGKTWWLDFMHRGERHYLRLGSNINRTVAKEIASVERSKILRSEVGIGRKRKDVTFEQAKEAFLAWTVANKKPNTVRSYRECLTRLSESPLFAGKRLSQITPWAVERYKQERAPKARVHVNRELAILRNVVNRMREWQKYEGMNPVGGNKVFLKEPRTRLRYIKPEEEAALLDAADEPVRTVILMGLYTGLRIKAELLHLRWVDVDLKRGELTVQAAYAKNGTTRNVPLNSLVREALGRLKAQAADEFLFLNERGLRLRDIDGAFAAARKKAGLSGVTPHTTRHTFASRLAMEGVDLRTIQELGGWKTLSQVGRYSHLSESHKAEAVERIAAGFVGAIHDAIHDTGSGKERVVAVTR